MAPHDTTQENRVGREIPRFSKFRPAVDRIADKVEFLDSGCWRWTAAMQPTGYGAMTMPGTRTKTSAHRVVYQCLVEPVDPDLVLDHLCRNRACVNPDHLEPVTHRENLLRGVGINAINAAKTHCIHGHEFTPENTYLYVTGRQCRTCRRNAELKYRSTRVSTKPKPSANINVSPSPVDTIFVSVKEAARILSLTPWSVYKLLDDQVIRSQYHGRKRLVRVDSLTEYADGLPIVAPTVEVDAS